VPVSSTDLGSREHGYVLANCHGFRAVASDGLAGAVETPLFDADDSEPDYLIIRVRTGLRLRRPVVPAVLVEAVDPERRLVYLRGSTAEIARLPEHLPLAGRAR
jgi:hypothetical protein